MKNLPDKIYAYIPEDDIVGTASTKKGVPHQYVNIEYIRKDAFINKACEWLKQHSEDYDYTWYDETESNSGITDKCIEQFKKYMED